jgi:hypothetical protein
MSTLESQVASLSLIGYMGWQCVNDLVLSDSSVCSSPTSDTSDLRQLSDNGNNDRTDIKHSPPTPPTLLEQMISDLPTAGERPLLQHLIGQPATLSDVESLVPALIGSPKIMGQLVVNIAYYNACGVITPSGLETILIHLLAVGDERHDLYETTKARIELENRRHRHFEQMERQNRIKEFKNTGRRVSSVQHSETIGDFSRSRLHNGPGLTDRKHPKVRLPQNDTRQVSTMPHLLVSDMNTRVEHDHQWSKTGPTPYLQFGERRRGEKIVVKLPPVEPSSRR